jgi:O-antigen ligase
MLGVALAMAIFAMLSVNSLWRRRLLVASLAGTLLVVGFLAVNWNTTFVQTTIRHRDPAESNNINSDDQRSSSIKNALSVITKNPQGTGVGTVNLASTYGENPTIVENYYLQIGQELGVLGLAIFLAILVMVALKLWQIRAKNILAVALLSGFIGLAFVNMLLPSWGDETVSMLWWGLAGIVICGEFAKNKAETRSKNAKR